LAIQSGPGTLAALASPSAGTCFYCQYRPGCAGYWQARDLVTSEDWPIDARGTVRSARRFANGRIMVEFSSAEGSAAFRVRGLSADEAKYPGLSQLAPGNLLAIYNLRPDHLPDTFTETALTAVYINNQ